MSMTMYRLLTVALCITASVAAPQSTQNNSYITHVKLQPDIPDQPSTYNSSRESRIENIPLTIPNIDRNTHQAEDKAGGNVNNYPDNEETTNVSHVKSNENINSSYPDKVNYDIEPEDYADKHLPKNDLPDTKLNQSNNTEIIAAESKLTEIISDSVIDDNQTDRLASESRELDSRISDTTASYEEAITVDDIIEDVTVNTDADEETTPAPSPKLLPKLSHFGKSTFGTYSSNLIGRSGKRGFKSKCKCVKIWNCTKLQITVPRCPEEYFLCCS